MKIVTHCKYAKGKFKVTDRLKVGDRVVWDSISKMGRGVGEVVSYCEDDVDGQPYLVRWEGGDETHVTEDGTQNTNGMKWVRKMTPLEELL